MANEERCNELREALTSTRALMEIPMHDAADHGAAGIAPPVRVDSGPELSPELEEEIRRLEQALRDEGCETA
ncbi:MAG: hypothetical protein O2924_03110 [Chloroflexi bacterium]|nr:hypothetical protein [Chloroflexota bacterium]